MIKKIENKEHFQILDSTSTYLQKNYKTLASPMLVSASQQTAGRGQGLDSWESNVGGLFASLLVTKPQFKDPVENLTVKIAEVIQRWAQKHFNVTLAIKAPNDLLYKNKKICGILTESAKQGDEYQWVIIGIGFNLNQKEFSNDLKDIAVSLAQITGNIF